jgi:hypothetical protein
MEEHGTAPSITRMLRGYEQDMFDEANEKSSDHSATYEDDGLKLDG